MFFFISKFFHLLHKTKYEAKLLLLLCPVLLTLAIGFKGFYIYYPFSPLVT